jgi:hypothetical protein
MAATKSTKATVVRGPAQPGPIEKLIVRVGDTRHDEIVDRVEDVLDGYLRQGVEVVRGPAKEAPVEKVVIEMSYEDARIVSRYTDSLPAVTRLANALRNAGIPAATLAEVFADR